MKTDDRPTVNRVELEQDLRDVLEELPMLRKRAKPRLTVVEYKMAA